MLDLMEVPIGTEFYMSAPALGCVAMRVTDRTGTDLSVEYAGDTTAPLLVREHNARNRPPLPVTPDLCDRSFLDQDECRAYSAKRKIAKMYQDVERARDEYLRTKSRVEKSISEVLEKNADVIDKFPEMFL